MIQLFRQYSTGIARWNLGLFLLIWLSVVASPCMMAMAYMPEPMEHDCPHCPPKPCHELAPEDCDVPDSLDIPRGDTTSESVAWLPSGPAPVIEFDRLTGNASNDYRQPPVRAGPSLYLLNVRFKE